MKNEEKTKSIDDQNPILFLFPLTTSPRLILKDLGNDFGDYLWSDPVLPNETDYKLSSLFEFTLIHQNLLV